ncbi:MAG: hypothetical protein HY721_28155 [Planctomycetes bacterium]|nr:hypothetical protein [Planctomycetota bacterium]
MRCVYCGWIVPDGGCPCGRSTPGTGELAVPIGVRVLARAGRGPSMDRWEPGEVVAHVGPVHRVETRHGVSWCESDDMIPESPQRQALLVPGARVWALWADGRWYPGTVDGVQGPLRHVTWDDGDSMWLEAGHAVVMALDASPARVGARVLAQRWDGEHQRGTVEQRDGDRFLVAFSDGEEAWVPAGDIKADPPSPFLDVG